MPDSGSQREWQNTLQVSASETRSLAQGIFVALGAPQTEAALVADDLVRADLMGLASHGVMRVPEYVQSVIRGEVVPGGPISVVKESDSTALVDCGRNFGQVAAARILEIGSAKAEVTGVGCVVTDNSHHFGRIGSLVEAAARKGLVALAFVAVRPKGHFVAPWGGIDGRLGTNPIAYGVPTSGDPMVSDFATSAMTEGAVRLALRRGELLPEQTLLDHLGQVARDPQALYGPPPGALLPLGAPSAGHKGYALALLGEVLATALAGRQADDPSRPSNSLCLLLVEPASFLPAETYRSNISHLLDYVKSSRPRSGGQILVPGEREFAAEASSSDSLVLDRYVWDELTRVSTEFASGEAGHSGPGTTSPPTGGS